MEYFNTLDGFSCNYFELTRSLNSSLVLDNERGELVTALVKPGQKEVNADKALIALRNHSEAERRRRERINGHLATLRTIIPGTNKMDKAALLAEVIKQVKQLRRNVSEAVKGLLVPTDIDEVIVEGLPDDGSNSVWIRASLCCEYNHELLSDLKQALGALPFNTVRAEIATLGTRMVNVFVISERKDDPKACQHLAESVRQALRSVLDKFYASEEFTSRNTVTGKRRRLSLFSPSSSSALGDYW